MTKLGGVLARAGLAIGLAASVVGSASADGGGSMPKSHPILLAATGTSTNWAGWASYAGLPVLPQAGAVSYVSGDWVVPAVKCDAVDASSSVWVGIDGLFNGVVEQVGTEQACNDGVASYTSWWETYPSAKVAANVAVKPGDKVRGEVTYAGGGQFVLALTNVTTGQSFKTTQSAPSAPRSSAEWIVEAPYDGGVVPLANFGSVTISNARATINGQTGPIARSGLLSLLNTQGSTMVLGGGLLKAAATNPTLTGTPDSFRTTWLSH